MLYISAPSFYYTFEDLDIFTLILQHGAQCRLPGRHFADLKLYIIFFYPESFLLRERKERVAIAWWEETISSWISQTSPQAMQRQPPQSTQRHCQYQTIFLYQVESLTIGLLGSSLLHGVIFCLYRLILLSFKNCFSLKVMFSGFWFSFM
jgi:hypothetical protein